MATREKVYLKDTAIWDSIDHEASKEQFPETYAILDTLTRMSNKKLVWRCTEGHLWQALVHNRSRGSGCPFCSGQRVSNNNSLSIKNPELAEEWDFDRNELTPDEVTVFSRSAVWWICPEYHSWRARVSNRSNGRGCPFCSGQRVTDNNRLSIKNPELAEEWDFDRNELDLSEVSVHSGKWAHWVCSEGHSWSARINDRSHGSGCPKCAKRTSKIEKRFIESFIKKTDFTVTAHGMRLSQLKYSSGYRGVEVDILLYQRGHYLLVEYDGNYWHRDKTESDTEKSRLLLSLGDNILHVRIRENDLPELDLVHDRFAQFRHSYHASESGSIERTVKNIEQWFLEKIGE